MTAQVTPSFRTIQTIIQPNYTYQSTDSGSVILRSNNSQMMSDTLLILPVDSFLIIKNADNMSSGLTITCGDNALIEGVQNSITFSGLSFIIFNSDGTNWWLT